VNGLFMKTTAPEWNPCVMASCWVAAVTITMGIFL
jgi:hypothetical protein